MAAPFWRFYHNDHTGAFIRQGKQEISLDPGWCYLIPPESDLIPGLRTPVRHFFMHFTAQPPFERARPGVYAFRPDRELHALIRRLRAATTAGSDMTSANYSVMALALIHWALSRLPADVPIELAVDAGMARAMAALRNTSDQALPNRQLAQLARMAPNAFIRRFRQIMGQTPQAYSRQIRIDKACIRLQHSQDSLEMIAAATGFCNRHHFSRVFKQLRGQGPAQFRKRTGR